MEKITSGPRRILVPTDFSLSSDAALDYAWFLAFRTGDAIDVLHTWNPGKAHADRKETVFGGSACGPTMIDALSRTNRRGSVEVRVRLEIGDLRDAVIRIARTEHFELIVIGEVADGHWPSTGPHEIADPFIHGVARAVTCPVLAVRSRWDGDPESHATIVPQAPGVHG